MPDDGDNLNRREFCQKVTAIPLTAAVLGSRSASANPSDRDNQIYGTVRGVVENGYVQAKEKRSHVSGSDQTYFIDYLPEGEQKLELKAGDDWIYEATVDVEGRTRHDVTRDTIRFTYIRPPSSKDEMKQRIERLVSAGVTDLCVETFFHGETIYDSDIASEQRQITYPDGYFRDIIEYAHGVGLRIHAWVQSLYWYNLPYIGTPPEGHLLAGDDPVVHEDEVYYINKDLATWDKTGENLTAEGGKVFASPFNDEVTDTVIAIVEEIDERFDVDGISLDYTRFPGGDGPQVPRQYGYEPASPYDETRHSDRDEYSNNDLHDFRVEAVHDLGVEVGSAIGGGTIYSTAVFPAYYTGENDFDRYKSQDWISWIGEADIDWIFPMCYALDPNSEEETLEAKDEEVAFSLDAQEHGVTVQPVLAITSGHPELQVQYDEVYADRNFAGYGVWKAAALLEDDSYGEEMP